MLSQAAEIIGLRPDFLVAAFPPFLRIRHFLVDRVKVLQNQLGFNNLDVTLRVYTAVHMDDIFILEAADDMTNRIHLPDVSQELVAEPFSPARALDKTRNIDKLYRRGGHLCGAVDPDQLVEPAVRHRNDADIRIDRAKGIVLRSRSRGGGGTINRGLPETRQSVESAS